MSNVRRPLLALLWVGYVVLLLQAVGFVYFRAGLFTPIGGHAYPKDLFVPDPELGFRLRAGLHGHFRGEAYGHIPIRINEHGYRDASFATKDPDRPRVAVLGDSVVFGAGVHEEERFTEQLERHAEVVTRGVALLNLGVTRYTFGHYLVQMRVDVPELAPEAILLGFTLNDIKPLETSAPRSGSEPGDEPTGAFKAARRFVFRETYGGRFLRQIAKRIELALLSRDEREAYHTKWMRSVVGYWGKEAEVHRLLGEFEQFAALAASQGVPFAFIVFPELNDVLQPDRFSSARRTLVGLLKSRKISFCDLNPAFAAHPDPASLFLPGDSVHFTGEGHALARDVILACARQGSLPLFASLPEAVRLEEPAGQ